MRSVVEELGRTLMGGEASRQKIARLRDARDWRVSRLVRYHVLEKLGITGKSMSCYSCYGSNHRNARRSIMSIVGKY